MAIDYNSVKFLLWAKNLGVNFDRTLTLGHLGLACTRSQLQRALRDFNIAATDQDLERCFKREPDKALFADQFLRLLGAKDTVSVDRSDFEGATFLHDLNLPFPEEMRGRFDLVLDGGTLEHIFDFPSALRHCLGLVSVGGHFVAAGPANQFLGHGFYQFSPEIYFRVFTPENGFRLRKLVLYEWLKPEAVFYEVSDPAVLGARAEINSSPPVMLAVLAQRISNVPLFSRLPQQSDYAACWDRAAAPQSPPSRHTLGGLRSKLSPYWPLWLRTWKLKLIVRMKSGSRKMAFSRALRRLDPREVAGERSTGGPERTSSGPEAPSRSGKTKS